MGTCSWIWGAERTTVLFAKASEEWVKREMRGGLKARDLVTASFFADRIFTFIITYGFDKEESRTFTSDLFDSLIPTVSHCVVSSIALCLLYGRYGFALRVLSIIEVRR